MTQPLDLAPIQARCDAATPGPWSADGHEIYQGTPDDYTTHSLWIGETCNMDLPDRGDANGAFLANARRDVPALLAEVQLLRADNERITNERETYRAAWHSAGDRARKHRQESDLIHGEAERLRAELSKYIGHEPTIAEEMAELTRRLDAVDAVCDAAEKDTGRGTNVPRWVAAVRAALDGHTT